MDLERLELSALLEKTLLRLYDPSELDVDTLQSIADCCGELLTGEYDQDERAGLQRGIFDLAARAGLTTIH